MGEVRGTEVNELPNQKLEANDYLSIKSEGKMNVQECKIFWDDLFESEISNSLLELKFIEDFDDKKTDVYNESLEKIDNIKFVDNDINNETNESDDVYFSTFEERLNQTPNDDLKRGEWKGERGESKFIPIEDKIKKILESLGIDGIIYKDGIPDFSECSESTVEIEDMTEDRFQNFKQCDQKCAKKWNLEARDGRTDWTAREVKIWREENKYSWHERNDMKTCDLVPTAINAYFGHLGGVSECRKRDANENGGDFDE